VILNVFFFFAFFLYLFLYLFKGQPVNGSPFNLRVMGAPDATKVRVHGPGIEHGVLATFQSRFLCDTRGAGAGQLTVRVRGPKGSNFFFYSILSDGVALA
jgi:hypothetical protein